MIGIKIIKKYKNQEKGLSLIEIILAITLFTSIVLVTVGIFEMSLNGSRSVSASQDMQNNLRYVFDVISREIRMVKKDSSSNYCWSETAGKTYYVSNDNKSLYFRNVKDECVHYFLEEDNGIHRFKVERDGVRGYISADNIDITKLKFVLNDITTEQALVTINIEAEVVNKREFKQKIILQTTISSRYYE